VLSSENWGLQIRTRPPPKNWVEKTVESLITGCRLYDFVEMWYVGASLVCEGCTVVFVGGCVMES